MKKLPIGIQTFSEIRTDDCIYIDKTEQTLALMEQYKYVFLSRPRRFGKSLFLDTLKNIFEANKELFKGLYIYDKYDWSVKYPVIKISFSGNLRTQNDIIATLEHMLRVNKQTLGVECTQDASPSICFAELIRRAYEKYNQKVVILIDEYDKPMLDNIDNLEMANYARELLKGFYSSIKDNDEFIRFAFLTGVSKFSKVSIFSGLNNITDISLNPKYGNICGYTQNDVETSFAKHLEGTDFEKLKEWYNGYSFLGDRVYNPFDILLFISNNKVYKSYWFETGTPTFLVKLLHEKQYFLPSLDNLVVGEDLLNSFDINNINIETLLYQTGYLTIKEAFYPPMGGVIYSLKAPNREVQTSLSNSILMYLSNLSSLSVTRNEAYMSLMNPNLEHFKQTLITLFASIPYTNYTKNNIADYEGYYSSVIFAYIYSLGLDTKVEDCTNKGRIDLTVNFNNNVYIIEFKVDKENGLEQIKQKNYQQKYLNQNKNIYLVSINFSSEDKNVKEFVWEMV